MKINALFREAKKAALSGSKKRQYFLGAVGLRNDGTLVRSCNLPARSPSPESHAEARLAKKLDFGSIVVVVRILKNGELAKARPCKNCFKLLRFKGVLKIYYSINDKEYGVSR